VIGTGIVATVSVLYNTTVPLYHVAVFSLLS
jgi:hypothetical protein